MVQPARYKFARTRTAGGFSSAGIDIRILIIDDIEAWHSIYAAVLRGLPDRQTVAYARGSGEAVEKCRRLKPNVVVIAVGPRHSDGFEAARQIRQILPSVRLLFLGTASPAELGGFALAAGADGYISKRNVVLELVPALQAIVEGKRFIGQSNS